MPTVPVCELLISPAGLKDSCVIAGAADELQSNRKLFLRETAWDG
jgi:hypothetical protein